MIVEQEVHNNGDTLDTEEVKQLRLRMQDYTTKIVKDNDELSKVVDALLGPDATEDERKELEDARQTLVKRLAMVDDALARTTRALELLLPKPAAVVPTIAVNVAPTKSGMLFNLYFLSYEILLGEGACTSISYAFFFTGTSLGDPDCL
jgi:hypothetical protein